MQPVGNERYKPPEKQDMSTRRKTQMNTIMG